MIVDAPEVVMASVQTYNQTRHDHEMTLEKSTVIREIKDDEEAAKIPQIIYRVSSTCRLRHCAHLDASE